MDCTERDIDIIRGKLMVSAATQAEIMLFLTYVVELEALVEDASVEDFYGTEGWQRLVFNDD